MRIDKDFYNKNGYLVIKGVFNPSGIYWRDLLEEIQEPFLIQGEKTHCYSTSVNGTILQLAKKDKELYRRCAKLAQNGWLVNHLATNDKILRILLDLGLAEPCIATKPVLFLSQEKLSEPTVAHQDSGSICSSINSMVVWAKLAGPGGLEIVPKSHFKGPQWSSFKDNFAVVDSYSDRNFIEVDTEPGDLLVFNTSLVHRSVKNPSNEIRYVLSYRYGDTLADDWIDRGYPSPYLYKPVPEDWMYPHPIEVEQYFRELNDD